MNVLSFSQSILPLCLHMSTAICSLSETSHCVSVLTRRNTVCGRLKSQRTVLPSSSSQSNEDNK